MDVESLSHIPPWDWPDGADETILAALRDGSLPREERMLAAELAGQLAVMNDALAGALLEVVRTPEEEEELRGRAAISLGPVLEELDLQLYDDPTDAPVSEEVGAEIRRAFRSVYLDGEAPTYVRLRTLEASIHHPEPWHEGAVRSAYHSGDHDWMVTAVFCMGHLPDFDEEILEAVRSDDSRIRYEGVVAAGLQDVRKAWPHIRPLLLAPTPERALLVAAIQAVVGVRPEAASAVLAPLAESDDPEIAEAAEEAIDMAETFLAGPDDEFDDGPPPGPHGNGSGGRVS